MINIQGLSRFFSDRCPNKKGNHKNNQFLIFKGDYTIYTANKPKGIFTLMGKCTEATNNSLELSKIVSIIGLKLTFFLKFLT